MFPETDSNSLKLVMLGESSLFKKFLLFSPLGKVGKTSLSSRFVKNSFNDKHKSTVNAYFLEKNIQVKSGVSLRFAIWVFLPFSTSYHIKTAKDTAGQEEFNALMPLYYRNAVGKIFLPFIKLCGK